MELVCYYTYWKEPGYEVVTLFSLHFFSQCLPTNKDSPWPLLESLFFAWRAIGNLSYKIKLLISKIRYKFHAAFLHRDVMKHERFYWLLTVFSTSGKDTLLISVIKCNSYSQNFTKITEKVNKSRHVRNNFCISGTITICRQQFWGKILI